MATETVETDGAARQPKRDHEMRSHRLGLAALATYGSGSLVQDTANYALNNLLLFYLTIVCGLSGSEAGLALGIALGVDAFVDPLVGSLSDNSRSRHGRRHPWMLGSALPIVLALVMLFSIPSGLTGLALFAYALTALLAVRIGMSGFTVPFIALGAELSDDYAERSTIVAARVLFQVVAGIVGPVLAFGVFFKGVGGLTHRAAYTPFAWSLGVLVLLGAFVSTFGTLGARNRLHAPPSSSAGHMGRLVAEVIEVFRNRSFRVLFFACLILFISLGISTTLGLHANTYFWKLPSGALLFLGLAYIVGVLVGVFIASALGQSLEKRVIALIGISLIGLTQLVPASLALLGLAPPASVLPLLLASSAVTGIGGSAALIGFQSMMADAADEHEHLFGARREGLYFAGISLSAKASSGVGALVAGVVLDLVGFPHGLNSGGAVAGVVPVQATHNLALIYGPGAAVITAISVAILLTYRRGRADHDQIRDALTERRAAR